MEAAEAGHFNIVQEILNSNSVFQQIFPEKLVELRNETTKAQLRKYIDKYIPHLRQTLRVAPVVIFQRALASHPFRDGILALNQHIIGEYLGV